MAKVAIITGGSRGLGAAMSRKLGELGYNIALNYRSDSSRKFCDEITEELQEKYGTETLIVKADVGSFEGCKVFGFQIQKCRKLSSNCCRCFATSALRPSASVQDTKENMGAIRAPMLYLS